MEPSNPEPSTEINKETETTAEATALNANVPIAGEPLVDRQPIDEPAPRSVGKYIVDRLHAEGRTRYLFGVPGGAINGLYKQFKDDGRIQPVLSAHESGAVFAAYGYARASGGLGAVAVTSGPGATNAVTGMASAYCDGVPVMLFSAQSPVAGRNGLQDSSVLGVDTVAMMKTATRVSCAIDEPTSAVNVVERSLRAALTGRRGPVHIALAPAIPFLPISEEGRDGPIQDMRPVDPEAVERAAALVASGKRVAVIAGHGIEMSGAAEALRRLAEEHGLAVANTPKGRVFSERHPLSLGVFGMGGHRQAEEYIALSDVVVVVGTGFGEAVNGFKPLHPERGLVRIDIDPQALTVNLDPDVCVLADARAALSMLTGALHRYPRQRYANDVAAEVAKLPRDADATFTVGEGSPIHPSAMVAVMSEVLPRDTIIVPDSGNSTGQMTHHWRAEPGCYFSAWGFASMASALGVSTGVRLAKPHQPVVAVVGDGALAMNPGELHTQAEYNIKVITIVVNDGGHGMVDHFDHVFFGESASPARFRRPIDAALIAEGFGVRGLRASTAAELRVALAKALRMNGPCLIDAAIDPGPRTPISPRFMPLAASSDDSTGEA